MAKENLVSFMVGASVIHLPLQITLDLNEKALAFGEFAIKSVFSGAVAILVNYCIVKIKNSVNK